MPGEVPGGVTVHVDTRDFIVFAKQLKMAEPVAGLALMRNLKAAAGPIVAEAKANISGISSSIPPTIRPSIARGAIMVLAGKKTLPLAGLEEFGGKGEKKAAQGQQWHHPVFGNKSVMVAQSTNPYLTPAVTSHLEEVDKAAQDALDAAVAMAVL